MLNNGNNLHLPWGKKSIGSSFSVEIAIIIATIPIPKKVVFRLITI